MSISTTLTSPAFAKPAAAFAPKICESMASRLRPCGLYMMLVNADGSIAIADEGAPSFFKRFVRPQIESGDFIARISKGVTAHSAVCVHQDIPGVLIAAFPFVERRRMIGVMVLAAKDQSFSITEDVQRCCGQLQLDSTWLQQQAASLFGYTADSIDHQARLVSSMLSDQMRLAASDGELDALSSQLTSTYEELSLIYQISGGMRINLPPAGFFKQTCQDVLEVMSLRGIGFALKAGVVEGQEPVLFGEIYLDKTGLNHLANELLAALEGRTTPLLINDLASDPKFSWMSAHAQRLLVVPMQRDDQLMGCLFAFDKRHGEFDSIDNKLLFSIANESAIYLQNALLFEDVHGLMMGLLHSLTSAVDAKDAYTWGHSERVALLSRHLAKSIGMSDYEVERIYMAGLLHDLGKIGVPEAVLQKPGKLTTEEFEEMKKHPEIGARILRDIKQISDLIPGVMHHHERWDGKGYPAKLAGESIPKMGRIICLADCFDAMTSNRTYRKALSLETALSEIEKGAGTQFDPVLAKAFLAIGGENLQELLRNQEENSKPLMDLQKALRRSEAA